MKILIILFALFLNASMLSAQVTIGSDIKPLDGVLLDLKDRNSSNDATADKGLGMPRVGLTSKTDLFPMFEAAGNGYKNAVKVDEDLDHIGLMVYNAKRVENLCEGLYVWDGVNWQLLGGVSPEKTATELLGERTGTVTDRDGKVYAVAKFGHAGWWMVENLGTETRYDPCDGQVDLEEVVRGVPSDLDDYAEPIFMRTPGYPAMAQKEGLFYNWAAATNKKGGDTGRGSVTDEGETASMTNTELVGVQGLCPKGWHLPSDKEYNDLEHALIIGTDYATGIGAGTWNESIRLSTDNSRGGYNLAQKVKSPIKINNVANGGRSKTDGTGFNVLLISAYGEPNQYGRLYYLWTSSSRSGNKGWTRAAYDQFDGVQRRHYERFLGASVRCKRD